MEELKLISFVDPLLKREPALFDFEKDTVTSYFKKGLFKNINTKKTNIQ